MNKPKFKSVAEMIEYTSQQRKRRRKQNWSVLIVLSPIVVVAVFGLVSACSPNAQATCERQLTNSYDTCFSALNR